MHYTRLRCKISGETYSNSLSVMPIRCTIERQMADTNREFPYKVLGARLRGMREKLRESLAEVAGSVEIELDQLNAFEMGESRPTEDILLLLISHFGMKEDEASKLWQLAGYEKDNATANMGIDEFGNLKNTVMVMPLDVRIAYTDMAHVVANEHGVVMNFLQANGPNNQPLAVARVGMSREHAKSLIELLQKTLAGIEQPKIKSLPAPRSKTEPEKNSKDKNT